MRSGEAARRKVADPTAPVEEARGRLDPAAGSPPLSPIWLDAFCVAAPRRAAGRRRALELGCAEGREAAELSARGFAVTSARLCCWATPLDQEAPRRREGADRLDSPARAKPLDALGGEPAFEGVLVDASALPAVRLIGPDLFDRVGRALTPGGCFVIRVPQASAERDDANECGRFGLSEPELAALYDDALWSPPAIQTENHDAQDAASTSWLIAFALRR